MRPTSIPRTTTRLRKVRVITNMMSAVVALLDRLICLNARKNPNLRDVEKLVPFVRTGVPAMFL